MPQIETNGFVEHDDLIHTAQVRWKKEIHRGERSNIYNKMFYETYLLLISNEPARNIQNVYEEIGFLNTKEHIIRTIIDKPRSQKDLKMLSKLLSDDDFI
jgi:hypothetical protein